MTVEVGGAGTIGLATETTLGTYVPPTKWIPIRSETLELVEDKIYRMNLRGTADRTGAIQGYTHTAGDITFEVTPDVLVYFLYAARTTPSKVTTTYTFVPAHIAKASTAAGTSSRKTLSLLVARSGNPMAYVGLSVGQLSFSVDGGVLMCTASMIGTNESAQSAGTPSYTQPVVIGPGKVTLEIPTATARADADTFTLNINDNLQAANRLNGNRFAAYQNWGEREISLGVEVDFDTLTDFNAFTAQTIQAITLKGIAAAATEEVVFVLNATATDSAGIHLSGLGDVNRASLAYHGFYNTTDAYTITLKTAEVVT